MPDCDVQKVDYAGSRKRLLDDKQVLEWTGPRRGPVAGVDPKKLPGIVVDDSQAKLTGAWSSSTAIGPFVGSGYLHDGNEGKGSKSARFEVELPSPGQYEVRLAYSASSNRATNVPVTVRDAEGNHAVKVNQKRKPPIDGLFAPLGVFRFAADRPAVVSVSNAGTDGHVIVDAVQFLPAKQ